MTDPHLMTQRTGHCAQNAHHFCRHIYEGFGKYALLQCPCECHE